MSIYKYIKNEGRSYSGIETEFLAPRSKDRYLSSETYPHYNTELDNSNPRYPTTNWRVTPPTFVTYNVNLVETYDVQEIRDYVLNLVDNKTAQFVDDVTTLALNKMKENINISVAEAIEEAFNDITAVYGGSASDLIPEEQEEQP